MIEARQLTKRYGIPTTGSCGNWAASSPPSAPSSRPCGPHDIRIRHEGIKRLQHPVVGALELNYQALALPTPSRAAHELSTYTAQPETTHEERLKILVTWSATATAEAAQRSD